MPEAADEKEHGHGSALDHERLRSYFSGELRELRVESGDALLPELGLAISAEVSLNSVSISNSNCTK